MQSDFIGKELYEQFTAEEKAESGNDVTEICNYRGKLIDREASWVAMTLCGEISGLVFDGEKTWAVEGDATARLSPSEVFLYSFWKEDKYAHSSCDVGAEHDDQMREGVSVSPRRERLSRDTSLIAEDPARGPTMTSFPSTTSAFVSGWLRHVEVWIVADYELFAQFRRDRRLLEQRCVAVMNVVNSLLNPLLITTVLRGIEVMERPSAGFSTSDYRALLEQFAPRREGLLREGKTHDFTLLLSGNDFAGSTVGYAYLGEMCGPKSAGVVQHFPRSASVSDVAITTAHEIGHSLGMQHDHSGCSCLNSKADCMMNSGGMKSSDSAWSNCSLIYLAYHIDSFSCLMNEPAAAQDFPSCGNGKVDLGEQCDCGPPESCSNMCCDPETCMLKGNALCASGSCCNIETCRVFETGHLCRRAASECDLPEFCSGSSESCPKDVAKHDGFQCDQGKGSCFNGVCGSRDMLCKQILTPASRHPEEGDSMVERITKFTATNPCEEIFCLPYFWLEADERKIFSRKNKFQFYDNLPILVFDVLDSDGLTCGRNKTCVGNVCTQLEEMGLPTCSTGCSGNGICNNLGNCHCNDAYAPPTCLYPGFGGSLDSGFPSNPHDSVNYNQVIYLLFLCIIPVAALTLCFWKKIRKAYETRFQNEFSSNCVVCSKCLESCCCPCMSFLSQWLCFLGKTSSGKKGEPCNVEEMRRRKTICQVDMNIKPPETEIRSWGVASESLVTDVIVVTPKNSPKSSRKVRLPSSSPILRTKSYEDIRSAARHHKADMTSSDTEHDSDTEANYTRQNSSKVSMSSLLSIIHRFGRQKSQVEEKGRPSTTESMLPAESTKKEQNLRRIVVDPLSSLNVSRTETTRPNYRRSFSNDPKLGSKPPPVKPNSPLHGSEQHLHFIPNLEKNSSSKKHETKTPHLGSEPLKHSEEEGSKNLEVKNFRSQDPAQQPGPWSLKKTKVVTEAPANKGPSDSDVHQRPGPWSLKKGRAEADENQKSNKTSQSSQAVRKALVPPSSKAKQ